MMPRGAHQRRIGSSDWLDCRQPQESHSTTLPQPTQACWGGRQWDFIRRTCAALFVAFPTQHRVGRDKRSFQAQGSLLEETWDKGGHKAASPEHEPRGENFLEVRCAGM